MAEQPFLSSQGTEVNKNSTSCTSVVSPQKKKKKKKKKKKEEEEEKEKKNKEKVWGQTKIPPICIFFKLSRLNCFFSLLTYVDFLEFIHQSLTLCCFLLSSTEHMSLLQLLN